MLQEETESTMFNTRSISSEAAAAATTTMTPTHKTTQTSSSALPLTPLRLYYFSRRSTKKFKVPDMPAAENFVGNWSVLGVLWGVLFMTVPLSYCYIALVLLRELCRNNYPWLFQEEDSVSENPNHHHDEDYFNVLRSPIVRHVVRFIEQQLQRSRFVEYWCWLEAVFYILNKVKIKWLQNMDPLEASLSAAPLLELEERSLLWRRMMESEMDDPVGFLTGWFFDCDIAHITQYDVRDFCAWSMFEGRHQEHLTTKELRQLEAFVEEAEYRISLQLFGVECDDGNGNENAMANNDDSTKESLTSSCPDPKRRIQGVDEYVNKNDSRALSSLSSHRLPVWNWKSNLPKPRKMFRFAEESQPQQNSFFSNLFESYRNHYDSVRNQYSKDFHPVQDLRDKLGDLLNETAQQLSHAEEAAMARASQMYEHFVPTGSSMDKHLTAASQAAYHQLVEAWNSVKHMRFEKRLETARFLSQQRARIRQQLKGYRIMLNRMREMSSTVPSAQMVTMMRRITDCNVALESLEQRAQAAFVKATGFARKNIPIVLAQIHQSLGEENSPPRHFARYSSDPLLGIATYPLGFHLLVLSCTEVPLRIMMRIRGFERRKIGSVSYYFHPGGCVSRCDSNHGNHNIRHPHPHHHRRSSRRFPVVDEESDYDSSSSRNSINRCNSNRNSIEKEPNRRNNVNILDTPIIFVHGIGIGLVVYIPLIDQLLATGRPILLPEIPYVSGFRPWQTPSAVLSPGSVVSTMTTLLASHGYMRGTWVGHSYGTSWLSYMVQFAPHAVAALLFLDPICFSLHAPRLTKQFVYSKPDPGTVSYMVRTDMIVNWTIQRSFPWAWINLFLEQIPTSKPCGIFLSDKDALVPVDKVESYLRNRGVPICDFDQVAVVVRHNNHDTHHDNYHDSNDDDDDDDDDGTTADEDANANANAAQTTTQAPQPQPNLRLHIDYFHQHTRHCTVFRGDGHGDWTDRPHATVRTIAAAVEALCQQAEQQIQQHEEYEEEDHEEEQEQ